jgi:hypothetical protein
MNDSSERRQLSAETGVPALACWTAFDAQRSLDLLDGDGGFWPPEEDFSDLWRPKRAVHGWI